MKRLILQNDGTLALGTPRRLPVMAGLSHRDVSLSVDGELAEAVRAGKPDRIAAMVHRYSDRLYRIIRPMVISDATAQDILQDTWVRVIRKIHTFDTRRPLFPWLSRIAVNCCRDYLRRLKRQRFWFRDPGPTGELPDHDAGIADPRSESDLRRLEMEAALRELPVKYREVVVMKFYSGLTSVEIAEVLGIPEGTVKSRLHYALNRLRKIVIPEVNGHE